MKFVDERNQDYKNRSQDLFNTREIVDNIRHADVFSNQLFQIPIILFLLFMIYQLIFTLKDIYEVYVLNGGSDTQGIHVHALAIFLTGGLSLFIYHLSLASYLTYTWRKWITDEQIVNNIHSQAKILTGRVKSTSVDGIIFEYVSEGHIQQGQFLTNQWDRFNTDDQVSVFFIGNRYAGLL